jgi:hypothetical protein
LEGRKRNGFGSADEVEVEVERWKVEGWKPSWWHMRREQKKGSTRFSGYWSKDEYDSLS